MTESIYKEYQNKYYNPNDNDKKPGDNDNWKSIQEGFHRIGSTQLETSEGLTLGKGTDDETSVTAAELEEIKNPTQLETSGGLTLGKGTEDEVSVTPAELEAMKQSGEVDVQRYIPFIYASGLDGQSGGLTVNAGQSVVFGMPTITPAAQRLSKILSDNKHSVRFIACVSAAEIDISHVKFDVVVESTGGYSYGNFVYGQMAPSKIYMRVTNLGSSSLTIAINMGIMAIALPALYSFN